jgi:hypothetical protein
MGQMMKSEQQLSFASIIKMHNYTVTDLWNYMNTAKSVQTKSNYVGKQQYRGEQ